MNIFMTGTEGMIGSHLSEYLMKVGHSVTAFVGDITNEDDWASYAGENVNFDYMIHLAALAGVRASMEDPELYYTNNVDGTRLALEWADVFCKRILYASSSNAWEWWGNPYATTKKMNEVQAEQYHAIGMRFHTVWPGRDDMLYRMLERGEVEYINESHTRDFIHVEDLCSAIHLIMQNFDYVIKQQGPVVDIGTGHSTSVKSVAQVMGFEGQYRSENPQGERVHTRANMEYLHKLGWGPKRNILQSTGKNVVQFK